ncbi:hypothetical protein N0V83_008630 [Neocucurbitaria cava]|uniref:Uncharacterized protein n=1 Tax=Neocucurbitaria cava TaxID=798079 RepID=A0A9W9CJ32_9PLEO|nr:hypothetical protein N0V83_008630 [Neocucurbitaria cava]
MYQGNIYISYYSPRVFDNCLQDVTRQSSGPNVLTIASTDLHSIRKFPHVFAPADVQWDLEPWPVNYDDFNSPVPFSAYAGQRICAQPGFPTSSCTIVKPDEYKPYMLMPPQIRDLDANWKNCRYDKYAAFDPPIALHTAAGMFSSTVDAQPTSIGNHEPVQTPPTQPAPGQSGGNSVPVATSKPGSPRPADPDHPQPDKPSVLPQEPKGSGPTPTDTGRPHIPVIQPMPMVTIGPSIIPVNPTGGLIIQPGLTLRIGDPPMTIDGTTISVGPSGVVMVHSKTTQTIPVPDAATAGGGQHLTVGSSVLSIDPSGDLVIKTGLTLRIGDAPVTIDGTIISVGTSGVLLADAKGTSTLAFPDLLPHSSQSTTSPPFLVTVGPAIYTVVNNELVLGPSLTLSVSGAAAILAGTTVSMASEGVVLVSSSRTSVIPIESKGVEVGNQHEDVSGSEGEAKETGSVASIAAPVANMGIYPKMFFRTFEQPKVLKRSDLQQSTEVME